MIYDVNAQSLNACFKRTGDSATVAYDVNGEQIFPDEILLKVMTYNVQYFRNINAQTAMQNEIIGKYTPDIIGMQELGTYTVSNFPAVGQTMLADYPIKQLSNHKNKIMIAAKGYSLSNLVIADFQNQDPQDQSQYNETRAYMKADIVAGGKTVTIINTHLCYLTQSIKWLQMQEVFTIAEQCERCIITGDFNGGIVTEESDDYINMFKQFVDAGYNLANLSPDAGFHNTFTNSATATSLADLTTAPDTIIVSGNIDIKNVVFDDTKFSYLDGNPIDHIPVVATLEI